MKKSTEKNKGKKKRYRDDEVTKKQTTGEKDQNRRSGNRMKRNVSQNPMCQMYTSQEDEK